MNTRSHFSVMALFSHFPREPRQTQVGGAFWKNPSRTETAILPQSRKCPAKCRADFPGISQSGHRLVLGGRLAIEEPPLSAIGLNDGWPADAVLLTVTPPLMPAIGPLDRRAIRSVEFSIAVPEPGSVWELDGGAIWPMELALVVSVTLHPVPVDREPNL